MRPIVLSLCVFAIGCSGQGLHSPTSPTSTTTALLGSERPDGAAQTQAWNGSALPFQGSFTGQTSGTVNCPPTCPPTTLTVRGTEEGTASHLGRFTAAVEEVVNIATAMSTGTIEFTAANGDRLLATTVGGEVGFTPPNISHIEETATITGGTGRFTGASGTFTIRFTQTIDFATGTATLTGSFEGSINLNH
jgi:hypothetical protein